jgi:hypothetical protein
MKYKVEFPAVETMWIEVEATDIEDAAQKAKEEYVKGMEDPEPGEIIQL